MWTNYFKFVKLRRGRVITPSHGEIDFSRDDISIETCKKLFELGFPYLELTELGRKELNGIDPVAEPVEAKPKSDRRNGINSRFVLPHHRAYRSVHGGSLIYANFPIMIRKEDVTSMF